MTGRPRPELCVGVVVRRGDELLLIRRGQDPGAGLWSVPGGRVEGGETLAEAAAREAEEETGLVVTVGAAIGWVERITDQHHVVIVDLEAVAQDPTAPLRAGDDASEAAWVPLAELPAVDLVPGLLAFLTEHGIITATPAG